MVTGGAAKVAAAANMWSCTLREKMTKLGVLLLANFNATFVIKLNFKRLIISFLDCFY
jgi:hypothetical protein